MITQKAKYALKALSALGAARRSESGALRIEEIATRANVPKRFLEHILLDLRNAGLVGSRRGRAGGYELIRAPRDIGLGELLRLIDGPIAPLPCLSRTAYRPCPDCPDEAGCRIRGVFAELFWSYLLLIESLTLEDLLEAPDALAPLAAAR